MPELLRVFEFPEQCQKCPMLREYMEQKAFIENTDLPKAEVDRRMREDLLEHEAAMGEL